MNNLEEYNNICADLKNNHSLYTIEDKWVQVAKKGSDSSKINKFGWKVHVCVKENDDEDILKVIKVVVPFLIKKIDENNFIFKFGGVRKSNKIVTWKMFTIYFENKESMKKITKELDELLNKNELTIKNRDDIKNQLSNDEKNEFDYNYEVPNTRSGRLTYRKDRNEKERYIQASEAVMFYNTDEDPFKKEPSIIKKLLTNLSKFTIYASLGEDSLALPKKTEIKTNEKKEFDIPVMVSLPFNNEKRLKLWVTNERRNEEKGSFHLNTSNAKTALIGAEKNRTCVQVQQLTSDERKFPIKEFFNNEDNNNLSRLDIDNNKYVELEALNNNKIRITNKGTNPVYVMTK